VADLTHQFKPIGVWADPLTPAAARKRSPFKAGYEQTLDLLFREAALLGAKHLVLQVDLQERDIRRDGLPKANARHGPNPGVIVSFGSEFGPLRYATDAYDDWRSNLRAVALSLEALRAVNRHGVSRRGEQYRGWTAIPSAAPGRGPFSDRAEAETWMQKCAAENGIGRVDDIGWGALYRLLAKEMHPDRNDGSTELWDRLDAAAKVLGVRENKNA
jgi:hypothetical protein